MAGRRAAAEASHPAASPADDVSGPGVSPTSWALVSAYKALLALMTTQLAPVGLYPGQDRVLSELWRQDGISQTELAQRLGIEQPTVTKTLQRLERMGLVRRERDPADNRQVIVTLTVAGRAAYHPIRRARVEAERRLTEGLSEAERRQLVGLLDRVRENLQQRAGSGG